jgi:hypothetical protein
MLIFVREAIFVTMNLVHNANVYTRNPKKRRKISPNERHHQFVHMFNNTKQTARRELVLVEIFTRPCEHALRMSQSVDTLSGWSDEDGKNIPKIYKTRRIHQNHLIKKYQLILCYYLSWWLCLLTASLVKIEAHKGLEC